MMMGFEEGNKPGKCVVGSRATNVQLINVTDVQPGNQYAVVDVGGVVTPTSKAK
jgi:hypothetical protein